jgi:hypothetical protein
VRGAVVEHLLSLCYPAYQRPGKAITRSA